MGHSKAVKPRVGGLKLRAGIRMTLREGLLSDLKASFGLFLAFYCTICSAIIGLSCLFLIGFDYRSLGTFVLYTKRYL